MADDATFHACDSSLDYIVKRIEHDVNLAIKWFDSNYIKLNQDKCDLMISGHKFEAVRAKTGETQFWKVESKSYWELS